MLRIFAAVGVASVALLHVGTGAAQKAAEPPILSMKPKAMPTTEATQEGRVLIGRGKDYRPVSGTRPQQAVFDELMHNMKLRRDFAWQIVDQMLQPTTIKLPGSGVQVDVPLWQTWYEGRGSEVGKSNDELTGLITSFFEKLKKNPSADLATTADQALNEQAMKDLAQSVTVQNMTAVLRQNAGIPTKFGGQGTTLFSPSFVKHMMVMARQVENCSHKGITPATQPPSPDNFSHCIKEFPRDAVMVKTAWIDLEDGVAVHDTSPAGMTAVINEGTWPGGSFHPATPKTVKPAPGTIYTNETEEGRQFGLAAIHLVTKDVREWVWVSLWWSPDPASDFGADRPDGIAKYNGGVWSNYKMCVVSSFDEGDLQPWSHYSGKQETLGRSIRATFDAIQAHVTKGVTGNIIIGVDDATLPASARGPWAAPHNRVTSWCSNPFVEAHSGNGRTSCIGCHQLVLTESIANPGSRASFAEATMGHEPQFARSFIFRNFTADFSWAFQGQFQPIIRNTRKKVGFEWP